MGQRQRLIGRTQPVRLVVDDRVARPVEAEHEVDAPGQEAAHGRPQRRVLEPGRVRSERIAGRQVLAQGGRDRSEGQAPARVIPADQRQLELELVQPVRAGNVTESQAV